MTRRVVVTGMGFVTPLGGTPEAVVTALQEGRSAVVASPDYAELNFKSQVWAPVTEELPPIDRRLLRFMGRGPLLLYGHHAMRRAVADSGLTEEMISNTMTGCIVGTGGPSTQDEVEGYDLVRAEGPSRKIYDIVPPTMSSGLAAKLATDFHIKGDAFSITSACATSAHCIGEASLRITSGRQDVMFAGGADDCHPSKACGFDANGTLVRTFNDTPSIASRAFDVNRAGFVDAAGAGIIVLEEFEHAKRRGARMYAEIVGYGLTSDGSDMVHPSGEGAIRCMQMALRGFGAPIESVDYLNVHGTSTEVGDLAEAQAIAHTFEGDVMPWVSSTKSITGHTLGAAGVLEAIFSILMLQYGFVAMSANIDELDPKIMELGPIGQKIARETIDLPQIDVVMSNNFGFGGTNACLVFRRFHD